MVGEQRIIVLSFILFSLVYFTSFYLYLLNFKIVSMVQLNKINMSLPPLTVILLGLHQWEKFPKAGLHHEERFPGSVRALGYRGAGWLQDVSQGD